MSVEPFSRDDIIAGLRDLVAELKLLDATAGVRLVGGAALVLGYFERGVTHDVDSLHIRPGDDDVVLAAAQTVARSRGWAPDWFNFGVTRADALPTLGREAEWVTIYQEHGVHIQIGSKETLLAMKLRSNRPGRDVGDIRALIALCSLKTVRSIEDLYEDFYPGDSLSARALGIVTSILEEGTSKPLLPVSPIRW